MEALWAVVLAAGEGKRMRSRLPKVLHQLCGRPIIEYILDSAVELTDRVLVVVGHGALLVRQNLGDRWQYVLQKKQKGTGHAVVQALNELPQTGNLLVLCGDTPLLTADRLRGLIEGRQNYEALVATAMLTDPGGYGRIVRGDGDAVIKIVEDADATPEELQIGEVNTGTYCFSLALLRQYLPMLSTANAQGEYYLTDIFALMNRDGRKAGAYLLDDSRVGLGINSRTQLAEAAAVMRRQINRSLMLQGVTMDDPATTYIDYGVRIGSDTLIKPNTLIEKQSVIGSHCTIGPQAHLRNARVGDGSTIANAVVCDTEISAGTFIHPYTVTGPGFKSPASPV